MIASQREQRHAHLTASQFDVLVIGGGIVGASIARDAALRGLRAALVDQGDFASGASSKTSKLIHGGLRYLEHGRLRLVAESLRERHTMRTIAPTLVHPLSVMIPLYTSGSRPPWKVRVGLTAYDLLAGRRGIRGHRVVSARRAAALEPNLRIDELRAAALYADCQMDDARLCLATVLQAASFGAVCGNYLQLRELLTAQGRVCGGAVEDLVTGHAFEVRAKTIVNAAGPWADAVRRLSRSGAAPRLAPTKGIHLVVPRLSHEALLVEAHRDRRLVFVLPWGAHSLVGTTESPVEGALEALQATTDEVGYLLDEVNRVLPGSHLDAGDVVATFAGARPLLGFSGSSTGASREHRIEVDEAGLISVLGGKYTTARVMAQQAVDHVVGRLRCRVDRCLTDQISLMETPQPVALAHWQDVARSVDPDLFARFLVRYGSATTAVLRLIAQEPVLAQPVCPHHAYATAELIHAFESECALTITDILARRTRIAWSACHGLDALPVLTDVMQRYGAVSQERLTEQIDAYQRFIAAGLSFHHAAAVSRAPSRHQARAG